MEGLTQRQGEVYRAVVDWIEANGQPPTVRELAGVLSVGPRAVFDHLQALIRKGYLRSKPGLSRGLEVVGERGGMAVSSRALPIIGRVAAGVPLLAEENWEGALSLDRSLLPPADCFLLRVTGDSMTGAHILDGDLVVVRPTETAEEGQIVVALLGEEATVKRFSRRGKVPTLLPENPAYQPIVLDGTGGEDGRTGGEVRRTGGEVRIIGRVVGLIREGIGG